MAKGREDEMMEMGLSALSQTVIFRVGKPGSDVTRRCSKHVGWFLSVRRLAIVRRGLVLVRQLRDMNDFHPKSRVCLVSTFGRVGINRAWLPILLVVS